MGKMSGRTETKQVLEARIRAQRAAVLVVNTQSRRGARLFAAAVDALERRGFTLRAAYPVREPARLQETVRAAIAGGTPLVIIGGGDGTISSVVDAFAYQDVVLGLLPLGTGNSYARTLGIPLSLDGAVDVIANGKVVDVDLGQVGSDYFANVASIGFTTDVVRHTPPGLKRALGALAYGLVGARLILSHAAFRCRLTMPTGTHPVTHTLRTHQIIIAKGSVYGLTRLTPEADVDSGQLVVFTMQALSRWRMLKVWANVLRGHRAALADASYVLTREVTIDTDPPQHVCLDGEVTTPTPAHVAVAPEALKILAPRTFADR